MKDMIMFICLEFRRTSGHTHLHANAIMFCGSAPKANACNDFVYLLTHTRLMLGLHPANERRYYKVMPSLIGWTQT